MKSTAAVLSRFVCCLLMAACAAKQPPPAPPPPQEELPKVRLTAADFYRPELVSAEFTNEVDEKRYRAIGDILEEFAPNTGVIYFVGKLRKVPTQARIQVVWYHDAIAEPMLAADVFGSDTFSFISNFTPEKKKFMAGNYTVKVMVNDQEVGSDTFRITGVDPSAAGLKVGKIQIAKKVNSKGAPVNPAAKFTAADKLFASFPVRNVFSPTELTVRWMRAGALFNESTISVNGNGRFSANIESPSGLPQGTYTVQVDNGSILKEASFVIGEPSAGPAIDYIALGEQPGNDVMPKKESDHFREGIPAIHCGLRFLDLAPGSEILIQWVLVEEGSESVYHTVRTPVPGGGSGAMSAAWNPGNIYAGNYKARVYINDQVATEKEFTVQ